MIARLLVLMSFLVISMPAFARTEYTCSWATCEWKTSAAAACREAVAKRSEQDAPIVYRYLGVTSSTGIWVCDMEVQYPGSTTWAEAGGTAINTRVTENACEAKMGEAQMLQFKLGWAMYYNNPDGGTIRTSDGGSVTPVPPMGKPPFQVCLGGCAAVGGSTSSQGQYADLATLANQHVQIVENREYAFNGKECTSDGPETDLSGENPGADGDNGGGGDGDGDGDGGGGDDGGGGGGDDNPGGGSQDPPGTPPKPKPDGGEPGDGPGGGSGGNNDPQSEAACGVAGKPPCNTQIDESGTPTGPGDKMNRDNIDRQYDKLKDSLGSIWNRSDKDTSWGVVPDWFASTGCTPWSFGQLKGGVALTIDYCPAVPFAKGATTFMWVVVTFFAVVAMVGRTVGAGS